MHPDLKREEAVEARLREQSRAYVEAIAATRARRVALGQRLLVIWIEPVEPDEWADAGKWRLWVYAPSTPLEELLPGGGELSLPSIADGDALDGTLLPGLAGSDAVARGVPDEVLGVLAAGLEAAESDRYDPGVCDGAVIVCYVGPDDEDEGAPERRGAKPRIEELIDIHLIPELHWCHTHGLAVCGLPELEVRGVPLFLFGAAGDLLNRVAEYLLENPVGHVKLGQTMGIGRYMIFRFVKLDPISPDQAGEYEVERWCLVEVEGAMKCTCCHESIAPGGGCAGGHEPGAGGMPH